MAEETTEEEVTAEVTAEAPVEDAVGEDYTDEEGIVVKTPPKRTSDRASSASDPSPTKSEEDRIHRESVAAYNEVKEKVRAKDAEIKDAMKVLETLQEERAALVQEYETIPQPDPIRELKRVQRSLTSRGIPPRMPVTRQRENIR